MKHGFSLSRGAYLIDEQQNRHELKWWIRGICGALSGLTAYIVVRYPFQSLSIEQGFLPFLLSAIIYILSFLVVMYLAMWIIVLLSKAGCKGFFENEHDNTH